METNSKNKWQVRVAALVIFVLGFAAGALSLNLYRKYRPADQPPAPRARGMEKMLDKLSLSPEQNSQVDQIMSDTRAELGRIRKSSRERLQKVLSEDQWKQLREMMKNRERRQKRQQQEGQ